MALIFNNGAIYGDSLYAYTTKTSETFKLS